MNVYQLADHPKFKPERNLITRKQLMDMWSIRSVNTIKNYEKKGLPVEHLPGGAPRYDSVECRKWLTQFKPG